MSRNSERIIREMWPDWELGESLGEGSFGEVQAIRRHSDYGPDLVSAVKVIRVPYMQSDVKSRRLQGMSDDEIREFYRVQVEGIADEIKIMQSLVGAENVVVIHDFKIIQQDDGVSWAIGIRMEKLEPLEDYYERTSTPDAREVARLGIDVCNALQRCHEKNIVHRDVKPANVFYRESSDGYALGDFGIARQMQRDSSTTLSQRGTPFFMAPELYHGEHYSTNVDVYSLGIMLYRYLNHLRYPFCPPFPQYLGSTDEDKANRMRLQRNPLPPLEGINPNLSAIVCKACDPNPRTRYASAAEMREDLKTWLKHPDRQIVHEERTVYAEDLDEMTAEQDRAAGVSDSTQSPVMPPPAPESGTGTYVIGADAARQYVPPQPDYQFVPDQVPPVPPVSPEPEPQKKGAPILIGVSVALFLVAVFLGVQIYNNATGGSSVSSTSSGVQDSAVNTGTTTSKTTSDEEKIQQFIDDAAQKASTADYAGAIAIIEQGLKEYPNSELLKAKKETYEAKKAAEKSSVSQSQSGDSGDTGTIVSSPSEPAPAPAPQATLSPSTIPRNWSGNYVGTFYNADGSEYDEERTFHMTLSSVADDGSLSGVVEVDEESYHIVGDVDWDTRAIEVEWAGWIVNKGTNSHRRYYGTISSDLSYISGTTVGIHETDWYCTAD